MRNQRKLQQKPEIDKGFSLTSHIQKQGIPETQQMFCSMDQALSMREKRAELFCPIHHCAMTFRL